MTLSEEALLRIATALERIAQLLEPEYRGKLENDYVNSRLKVILKEDSHGTGTDCAPD